MNRRNPIPAAAALTCTLLLASTCLAAGWELQTSGTTVDLHGVTANHSDIDIAWACGDDGTILYTSNGGATWEEQDSGTSENLYAIAFQETQFGPVIAVGANGTIVRTQDAGVTWETIASGTTNTLRSISDFSGIACGDNGTVLRTPDVGLTWTLDDLGTNTNFYAATGTGVWQVVGEGGALYIGTFSSPWSPRDTGTTVDLLAMPMFSPSRLIVGGDATVLRSSGSWQFSPVWSGAPGALRGVQYSQNNTAKIYAVGDGGTILKSTNAGATWNTQQTGTTEDLNATFFYLDDTRGWAVGNGGTILRTNDGGGPLVPSGVGEDESGPHDPHHADSGGLRPTGPRLRVTPHPAGDEAHIRFALATPGNARVDVYDLSGRHVLGWSRGDLGVGLHESSVSLRGLPSGTYVYRLHTPDGEDSGRLVRR
ncbi:MAG: T9SS type A sorting domain-containing protein [Candidatus Eisenbacteria bacterium]|uniref:T9SS type A sorting domain-containing protein n=1 Tax=Eiseniibacteriota bacterium TaxID=2212470 RepID=A0A956SCX4_UNCEI|nr:T9SS type A sorting domain-containing protein [Candidatus Eisenbacteria bacterium]MCB9466303.1 T9SS type A sorting domain-containing protein [Candidatus Eisenbacteria bacterium]